MSHYYFNAILSSKILTYCTMLNQIEQNKTKMSIVSVNEYVWQQFLDKKWLKNSVRKQFLPKVAETLVETYSGQDGLNLGLNRCWRKLANPEEKGSRERRISWTVLHTQCMCTSALSS